MTSWFFTGGEVYVYVCECGCLSIGVLKEASTAECNIILRSRMLRL